MKNFKLFLCLLATCAFISSCSDDDDDNNISFDKNKVSVIIGKTETVTVKNGDGTYEVKSSDDKIATVKITGKDITITAVKEGNTVITVTDKSKNTGTIAVSVTKDPNEAIKADTKTRFVHDKISKIEGTDKGTYKLSQGTDGKVEFSWKSEDAKSTIVLSFADKAGDITEGIKKDATLTIDGKAVATTDLEVIQSKVVKEGEKATIWIVFTADKKSGVCVGQLS